VFGKLTQIFGLLFSTVPYDKKNWLGDFFTNSSGYPEPTLNSSPIYLNIGPHLQEDDDVQGANDGAVHWNQGPTL
jgi:hypothetical protein